MVSVDGVPSVVVVIVSVEEVDVVSGAPAVGTDPHPNNARAIRACKKAGFKLTSGPVDTPWGRAVLMERWP